jgi:CheY-like chemotaxis protein
VSPLQKCVLVVEDEPIIAELWCMYIEGLALDVCGSAATAEAAIALAEKHHPAVILMDMRLRGKMDGVDASLAINASVGSRIIFVTGSKEPETLARIQLAHPEAVLFKPVGDRQLRTAILSAMRA